MTHADLNQLFFIDYSERAMKEFVLEKLEQMGDKEKDEFRQDLWEFWGGKMFDEKYTLEFWDNYLIQYDERIVIDFGDDEYCKFNEVDWGNELKELERGIYLGFVEFYNKHKGEWVSSSLRS